MVRDPLSSRRRDAIVMMASRPRLESGSCTMPVEEDDKPPLVGELGVRAAIRNVNLQTNCLERRMLDGRGLGEMKYSRQRRMTRILVHTLLSTRVLQEGQALLSVEAISARMYWLTQLCERHP